MGLTHSGSRRYRASCKAKNESARLAVNPSAGFFVNGRAPDTPHSQNTGSTSGASASSIRVQPWMATASATTVAIHSTAMLM